jgi:hypothetical protein
VFFERKKVIFNQVKRASYFVKIIVACPHRLPKLPESTQRKHAIPNKGSLFYSHCGLTFNEYGTKQLENIVVVVLAASGKKP